MRIKKNNVCRLILIKLLNKLNNKQGDSLSIICILQYYELVKIL